MGKPVAWSFSALNNFQTCPRQFYETRVAKNFKDEMGEAALWGDRVHKALDRRITHGTPLPEGMTQYEKYAKKVLDSPGELHAERKLCLTPNLEPTKFFAKDAWVRGIIDVSVVNGARAWAGDWKTGKRKLDSDQLKLFAGMMFATHSSLEVVKTTFIWLKEGKADSDTFTRDQVPEIWQHFQPKVRKLELAHERGHWPPNPSGLCRKHCPVLSCEFNGRRDDS